MTLEDLVSLGKLEPATIRADELARLLDTVRAGLLDVRADGLAAETRFALGYRAIVRSALVATRANGYRPVWSSNQQEMLIRLLPLTIGLAHDRLAILDQLSIRKNGVDSGGAEVPEELVAACLLAASELDIAVRDWLATHRADLLP